MEIQKVEIKDAEALLDIYGPYVTGTAITFECQVPSVEEFQNRIQQFSAKFPYIKAVENGEIIGYAYASSFKPRAAYNWCVESTVYVKSDCKRRSVGRALYEALERSLKGIGILNMIAFIAFPKSEDAYLTEDSFKFHTRMGFQPSGRLHDAGYKFGSWYDMVSMEKLIGDHPDKPAPVDFGNWEI